LKKIDPAFVFAGLGFALLWASASTAGKFGLQSVEPLTFFTIRFLVAGVLLLIVAHALWKHPLPRGVEWRQIAIFGAFNTALYLGIFILVLRFVAAGITTMAIAINPLMIGILSAIVMKRKVLVREWVSILLGMLGVAIATYPLLQTGHSTLGGVLLIVLCMLMYSIGAVYYASVKWQLPRITINGWQVLFGGLMLVPFAWLLHQEGNQFDTRFWISLAWLIVPVSILAVQLWLRLLKDDAVRASLWLFLCPVFGFMYATFLLHEPFTLHTAIGATLVIVALYIGQFVKK
jgi:drug/metabolite transporter (DMT)-like permease